MKKIKKSLKEDLKKKIQQSVELKLSLEKLNNKIFKSIDVISNSLKNKKKIFFCGNGGSCADAQHLAAELTIRLRPNMSRKSLPAISLALDTSTLTACGNDFKFEYIFSRPLESLGNKGDILIAISTSGNSKNIVNALKTAKAKGLITIGLLGNKGGKAKKYCDIDLVVPSNITARIQECHIFLGHYILEETENKLFHK
jgi:D-sedoheptulose 7-phosphate isomerase